MPVTYTSAPETPKPHPGVRFSYDLVTRKTMGMALQLCYMIAIPAFFFGFAGAYLDRVLNTHGAMMFFGLILAMIISTRWVIRYVHAFVTQPSPSASTPSS